MTHETSQMPALLFDLDGALMDSVYQHVLAWHEALEELGMSLGVWRVHRRIGMSGGPLVQALSREIGQGLTPEQVQKLQERHAVAYERYQEAIQPLPGARELLQQLSRANVPYAIATSGQPEAIRTVPERLGVGPGFPSSHGGRFNAQGRIRICFSLRPKSSTSLSQEPWLSATVYGTCWRPGGRAVLESVCSQKVMGRKNWNRSALIACIKIRPTY